MARTTAGTYVEAGTHPQWSAVVWSGLIAGLVFVVLEMALVALIGGGSAWGPPRMIAAIAMGSDVLPPPATFDFGIVAVGLIVHFVLALILATILAYGVYRMTMGSAIATGAAFGLLIYLVNFYLFTAVFPWFAEARTGITIFAHIVFGLVLAWSYKALAHRRTGTELKA